MGYSMYIKHLYCSLSIELGLLENFPGGKSAAATMNIYFGTLFETEYKL